MLFTILAIVSHTHEARPGSATRITVTRVQIALVTVPVLLVAIVRLFQRPLAPFTCPDGHNSQLDILFSKKSNSGRIVVGDAHTDSGYTYRYLRADHSILGGQWLWNVSDGKGGTKIEFGDS